MNVNNIKYTHQKELKEATKAKKERHHKIIIIVKNEIVDS